MAEETDVLDLPDELSSANRRPAAGGSDAVMGGMADIKSRETDEKTRVFGETERRMEEDRTYMRNRMDAAGLEVEKLRPWNHDEEARKRTADPLETFGSLGSVFGILASAFTRAPMEAALNASAAAMNAVKAANDDDYKKAYTSWKDNMALVEKRHNMIQAQFNDAQALFRTDMAAGTVKAQNIAARYGDEQSLFLLDNGMNKEFFDLQTQRATAWEKMSEANRKITENTFRDKVFENLVKELPEEKRNDPMSQMRVWNYAHGMNTKIEEDVMMQWWADHPKATAEEAAKFAAKYKADQRSIAAGGNANLTTDRQRAQDVLAYRQKLLNEVDEDGKPKHTTEEVAKKAAEYENSLKATATPASGNQRDQLRSMVDRTKYFESNIDNVEGLLAKHNAISGLGGKVTRPAEIIGNILGSNETDRKQFERWIAEMQEWAPRMLNESKGRPLASEAAKVNSIVAGLSLGDTTANTVRAYRELRPLIQRIREDMVKRLEGTWTPPPAGGGQGGSGAGGAKPKWMDAPIVGPRSDAGTNDNVAQRGNVSDEIETGSEVIDVPPGRNPRDFIPKRRVG